MEPEKNMKGLVGPSVGGGPGARAPCPPPKSGLVTLAIGYFQYFANARRKIVNSEASRRSDD